MNINQSPWNYFSRVVVLLTLTWGIGTFTPVSAQNSVRASESRNRIPAGVMLQIVRAEDERRWDSELQAVLGDSQAEIRRRAALAAGRIGDEHAVPALALLLKQDADESVRAMAAFALGETE